MDIFLIVLAILCIAYFIIIVLYAGIGTSFAFIWLFFAALSIFLVYGKWYYRRNREKIPGWVPVSVVTTCIAGVTVMAVLCLQVFLGAAGSPRQGLDYVIVLGAIEKEHTFSDTLKKRLDRAMEYASQNPDTVLVLSGGRTKEQKVSEAELMYRYLVYNGVNPKQLLIEDSSISTVENIAYSKIVIEEHRKEKSEKRRKEKERRENFLKTLPYQKPKENVLVVEDKPLEIGVLTSNFHVYRARLTAKKWGFDNVYGISAQSDPVLFIHLCVRECASIVKDRLMGNM